jgi:hypothetical protein
MLGAASLVARLRSLQSAATLKAAKLARAGAARVTGHERDVHDAFTLRQPDAELLARIHHDPVLADGRQRLGGVTPPSSTV